MLTNIVFSMRKIFGLICLITFQTYVFSQEKVEPDYIKSVIFKSSHNQNQFPIVELGERFELSFDDLNADETNYYYTITHCNYNWEPSELIKSEYLVGIDDVRITNYQNSYTTLQPYTHYKLTLPNEDTSFRLTGNYLLSVTDSYQNVLFTRRFVIYANASSVQMEIKQSRDIKHIHQKQVVQFKINSKTIAFEDPKTSVKVAILQNYSWENALFNIQPQYLLGNELVYKYDQETSFWGGNEYFYFENKDIRVANTGVYDTWQNQGKFQSILYTAPLRKGKTYTYNPDVNGDFRIVTSYTDPNVEAEYSEVFFSVEAHNDWINNEVFVYGNFTQNKLIDTYKLNYNPEKDTFDGKIYLKQGFYNYKFALKNQQHTDYNAFSGNHYQTENNYTIIVYYRPIGQLYDKVIGVNSLNSLQISL